MQRITDRIICIKAIPAQNDKQIKNGNRLDREGESRDVITAQGTAIERRMYTNETEVTSIEAMMSHSVYL
jgi:hypothetical protein